MKPSNSMLCRKLHQLETCLGKEMMLQKDETKMLQRGKIPDQPVTNPKQTAAKKGAKKAKCISLDSQLDVKRDKTV